MSHRYRLWLPFGALLLVAVVLGSWLVIRSGTDAQPPQAAVPTTPFNPYEQQRRAGVQTLLDRWAQALRADDQAGLTALFDPQAAPEFVRAQRERAANLRPVPLRDWGFEIGNEPDEPADPAIADRFGASDIWAPPVYLRYALDGPDAEPTRKPVALTVVRHGDSWFLASDAPVDQRRSWRGPWDFGPLTVQRVAVGDGRTALVMGHPEQAGEVSALAAEVSSAVPAVTELWGNQWSRTVAVVASGSVEEFRELAGPDHSGADIAAVTVADRVDPGRSTVTGQRIVFSPDAATRLTAESRRSVLRHELTHVAARSATVDGSPLWMLEGFADYSGYRKSGRSFASIAPTVAEGVRIAGPPNALPADADFGAPDRATLAYELGWSLCAYVAATFGEPTLVRLYRALARGHVDEAGLDAALRSVLQLGTTDFIARWGGWVAQQAR